MNLFFKKRDPITFEYEWLITFEYEWLELALFLTTKTATKYLVYKLSFKTTKDSKLQWLQFNILHRIIQTNVFLHKIKVKEPPVCSFVNEIMRPFSTYF